MFTVQPFSPVSLSISDYSVAVLIRQILKAWWFNLSHNFSQGSTCKSLPWGFCLHCNSVTLFKTVCRFKVPPTFCCVRIPLSKEPKWMWHLKALMMFITQIKRKPRLQCIRCTLFARNYAIVNLVLRTRIWRDVF